MPDSAVNRKAVEIDDEALRRWPLPLPGDGGKEERGLPPAPWTSLPTK